MKYAQRQCETAYGDSVEKTEVRILGVIKGIFGLFEDQRYKTNDYESICKEYIGITIVDTPENPFDIFGRCEMVALEVSNGYVRYKFRYPRKLNKWMYNSMRCSTYAHVIKGRTNEARQ